MKKLALVSLMIVLLSSCKKEESVCYTCFEYGIPPTLNTWAATGKQEVFCGTKKEKQEYDALKMKNRRLMKCH